MKRISWLFLLSFLALTSLFAKPVSQKEVKTAVTNWLKYHPKPLGSAIGSKIDKIVPYKDRDGKPLYYIVDLKPEGYVIVSGDDGVEPIIGFSASGHYVDSQENPISVLVRHDVPGRVKHERDLEESLRSAQTEFSKTREANHAKRKWRRLFELAVQSQKTETATEEDNTTESKLEAVGDVRVEPLLLTKWSQKKERGGHQCYNLFTPNHYPSGCVATAFGQILRYFEYPTVGVGTASYDIKVDGNDQRKSLLGGDGNGGAYNWNIMSYGPTISSEESRIAIGRLLNDTGVSVNMSYKSGGSGANTLKIADALKDTFSYENAVKGYNSGSNIETADRNKMINPNLDAGLPVALGIRGDQGGHAVVADGYAYDDGTLYHHLNMGWSGSQNAWYNLPNIDDDNYGFTSVYKIVYNIYTQGTGEIISGRVTDKSGQPIANATVTAKNGDRVYRAATNGLGIYALVHLPSNQTYTVTVEKSGFSFQNRRVTTGKSEDYRSVGNVWGVDFVAEDPAPSPSETPNILPIINYLLGS